MSTKNQKYSSYDEVPEEIIKKYILGRYTFTAPPVSTYKWTDLDWINYVTFNKD